MWRSARLVALGLALSSCAGACLASDSHPLPTIEDYTDGVSRLVDSVAAAVGRGDRAALEALCIPGATAVAADEPPTPPWLSPSGLRVDRRRSGPSGPAVAAPEALLAMRARFHDLARREFRIAGFGGRADRRTLRVHVRLAGPAAEGRRQEESWWRWEAARARDTAEGWRLASCSEERRTIVTAPRALFRAIDPGCSDARWSPSTNRRRELLNVAEPGGHDTGGVAFIDRCVRDLSCTLFGGGARIGLRLEGVCPAPAGTVFENLIDAGWCSGDCGESKGLLAADFDNDGTSEILVSVDHAPCRLFEIRADPRGTTAGAPAPAPPGTAPPALAEITDASGLAGLVGAYRSAIAFDADNDGRLDLYIVQYGDGTKTGPATNGRNGLPNRFFRNVTVPGGPIRFVDESRASGLDDTGWGLAAQAADFDGDGRIDLYVANDFGRHVLYRNVTKRGGPVRFVDVSRATGTEDFGPGMGVAWGDFDGDGDLDLYVSNYWLDESWTLTTRAFPLPDYPLRWLFAPLARRKLRSFIRGNSLFRNDVAETGRFTRLPMEAGVYDGGWAWGNTWTDADGDGLPDLVVANGMLLGRHGRDRQIDLWNRLSAEWRDFTRGRWTVDFGEDGLTGPQTERLFINLGDGTFAEASWVVGFDTMADLRGLIAADVTGDGVPDIVGAAFLAPPVIFENLNAGSPGRLCVRLEGTVSNRDAVGAVVRVTAGGRTQTQQVVAGGSFLSDPGRPLYFGLGGSRTVERVEVRWPSGRRTVLDRPPARDGRLEIVEPAQ